MDEEVLDWVANWAELVASGVMQPAPAVVGQVMVPDGRCRAGVGGCQVVVKTGVHAQDVLVVGNVEGFGEELEPDTFRGW